MKLPKSSEGSLATACSNAGCLPGVLMRASVRCGEYGRCSLAMPSGASACSVSRASAVKSSAEGTPAKNTRGECGLGKKPSFWMAMAMGCRDGSPPSELFNSARRSSGHSPTNLVVMCRLRGGLQLICAEGLRRCRRSSRLAITSGGRSMPMNRRICRDDNCAMEWRDIAIESRILTRSFYARHAIEVARGLLGKILVHGRTAGIIVETEAYLGGDDLAAHSARGVTNRTRVIFGPPGHAYVYFIYGMHECLNIVAEPDGVAGCVLIRAVEPLSGLELMRSRRPTARTLDKLASGPGNLTRVFGITRAQNGVDVTRGTLVVRQWKKEHAFEIQVTPRIGIRPWADWPPRFVMPANSAVRNEVPIPPAPVLRAFLAGGA